MLAPSAGAWYPEHMRTTIATLVLILLAAPSARANFASDPERVNAPGFAKFFFTKIDQGLAPIDPPIKLPAPERTYADAFVQSQTTFGKRFSDTQFLRSIDYVYPILNKQAPKQAGPIRLLDTENRADVRTQTLALLKKKAPKFDAEPLAGHMIGLGLVPPGLDVEVLEWEPDLSKSPYVKSMGGAGEVILGLKDSKVTKTTVVQLGVKAATKCPPATSFGQTDRLTEADGSTAWIFHLNQFEGAAIDPTGRHLAEKIRDITNLIPGTVTWKSYDDYSFSYP